MLTLTIAHNIRVRGATTPLRAAITAALTLDNPEYKDRKAKKRPVWGIESKLKLYSLDGLDLIVPRGFFNELKQLLSQMNIPKSIAWRTTVREPIEFGPWNQHYPLTPDQAEALSAIEVQNGVLVAPAGSGKTVMGMRYVMERKQPALWLTHTKDLLYQSVGKAKELLQGVGEVGILGDGKHKWGDGKLIVATVQTINENPQLIDTLNPLIGTVVIDEAHHFPAPAFIDVAGRFATGNMLGLTATPERKDKLEFYMYLGIGPKAHEIKRTGLYSAGRLIKPDVKFIYTDFDYEQASDMNSIRSVDAGGEDLNYRALLDALIANEARAKLIAETVLDYYPKHFSLVVSESIRYCYTLKEELERQAIKRFGKVPRITVIHGTISKHTWHVDKNAKQAQQDNECRYNNSLKRWERRCQQYKDEEYVAWQISGTERKRRLSLARQGDLDILIASTIAKEGLDLPNLSVGVLATPQRGDLDTRSRNGIGVEQTIGRIQRPDPNNPDKKSIWIDVVDDKVGVLKSQYYSRRRVYQRLELTLSNKPKSRTDELEKLLGGISW